MAYAALDLIAALKNTSSSTPLFIGNKQLRALSYLAQIFASAIYPCLMPQNAASLQLNNQNLIDIAPINTKNKQPRKTKGVR